MSLGGKSLKFRNSSSVIYELYDLGQVTSQQFRFDIRKTRIILLLTLFGRLKSNDIYKEGNTLSGKE